MHRTMHAYEYVYYRAIASLPLRAVPFRLRVNLESASESARVDDQRFPGASAKSLQFNVADRATVRDRPSEHVGTTVANSLKPNRLVPRTAVGAEPL